MPCRPAHLAAIGVTAVASLLMLAPTAHAETSPSYRCETLKPGKPVPGAGKPAPVIGTKCSAANDAPAAGDINGFFFVLDKATFYVCGIAPDGKLAPATEKSGTADLPGKLAATRCWAFKTDGKFTPEQFEQELAKQTKEKAPK
ncbi:hypothetical protein ABZ942_16430 [Nocardia sp. NPDC046473]|uniref:hypothetical protein n=1 Tax=Nocardia sp. NPDC046473 TaxID=3155733 RepID=UPI0033C6E9E9